MGCHCIPNGNVTVSQLSNAGSQALASQVKPQLDVIKATMCDWAQPTYGASGETFEKGFWKAALIAVATLNTMAQIDIMTKRYGIAKDYANMATDRWNRFKTKYAPLERAMLSETCNTPIPRPDYAGAKARAVDYTDYAVASIDEDMADLAKQFALCVDSSLMDDFDYLNGLVADDSTNYGYRDEESYDIYRDDQRWNRRSNLLNLGRDIPSKAASYADSASNALAQMGGLLDAGAQGAMKLLGYLNTAKETQYPAQFSGASPLTGIASTHYGSSIMSGPMAD